MLRTSGVVPSAWIPAVHRWRPRRPSGVPDSASGVVGIWGVIRQLGTLSLNYEKSDSYLKKYLKMALHKYRLKIAVPQDTGQYLFNKHEHNVEVHFFS